MFTKIAQLILTPGQKAASTSEVFVAQPDANKEALAGKLFLLIEIESRGTDNLKLINFLISDLNHHYYQNEKMILRERIATLKIEHILESALARVNKNLVEFMQAEKIKIDPGLINAAAGVVYENNLHFSLLGKNKAYLVYPGKKENEEEKYKIAEIGQRAAADEEEESVNLNKLFTNVISGSIPPNGYFVFTNETLPEYLSNKQLIDIITTLPPAGAVEQIKNLLAKVNAYVSFLGLVVKNTAEKKVVEPPKELFRPSVEESISGFRATEEKTEKLLTPSGGIVNIKKWPAGLKRFFSGAKARLGENFGAAGAVELKDKLIFKKRANFEFIKNAWQISKNIAGYLYQSLIYLPRLLTSKTRLIEFSRALRLKIRGRTSRLALWFRELSFKNKITFVVALLALVLLAQNLITLSYKNKKTEQEKNYTGIVNQIEQKQNQVEASLIYNNEEGAKKLLNEIKDLLAGLPRQTEEEKIKFTELSQKNEQQLEKIRHLVKVEGSLELANFANLNNQAAPANLILVNGKIYAADARTKSIYVLSLKDKLITAATNPALIISSLDYPTVDNGNNVYYLNGDNIIELNGKEEKITRLTLSAKGNYRNITSLFNYNNRLYALSAAENKIYRYNRGGGGFAGGGDWLKGAADFSGAVAMFIDGNIYVLKNDGRLLKYLKGEKVDFTLSVPEPPLSAAAKLFVSTQYIYVLEPSAKRLAVFNKNGKFLLQYQSDKLTDLKDFAVDEAAKKIYFLAGSIVYETKMEHLQ